MPPRLERDPSAERMFRLEPKERPQARAQTSEWRARNSDVEDSCVRTAVLSSKLLHLPGIDVLTTPRSSVPARRGQHSGHGILAPWTQGTSPDRRFRRGGTRLIKPWTWSSTDVRSSTSSTPNTTGVGFPPLRAGSAAPQSNDGWPSTRVQLGIVMKDCPRTSWKSRFARRAGISAAGTWRWICTSALTRSCGALRIGQVPRSKMTMSQLQTIQPPFCPRSWCSAGPSTRLRCRTRRGSLPGPGGSGGRRRGRHGGIDCAIVSRSHGSSDVHRPRSRRLLKRLAIRAPVSGTPTGHGPLAAGQRVCPAALWCSPSSGVVIGRGTVDGAGSERTRPYVSTSTRCPSTKNFSRSTPS